MSRCENCGYYWKEDGERYARCHYEGPDEWAPCEQDEDYDTPDVDEY